MNYLFWLFDAGVNSRELMGQVKGRKDLKIAVLGADEKATVDSLVWPNMVRCHTVKWVGSGDDLSPFEMVVFYRGGDKMQSLFQKLTSPQVNKRVILVGPETYSMVMELIRKGAGGRNFVWVDENSRVAAKICAMCWFK